MKGRQRLGRLLGGDVVPTELERDCGRESIRMVSVDIFRGLTILTMIFVNDVAGVQAIPAWMKHAGVDADCMTFVDVVFPAFLFIVGMSIPLALGGRLKRGESLASVVCHVLVRTLGLLIVGVLMVNIRGFNSAAAGMSKDVWVLLMFTGVMLVWNRYPQGSLQRRRMQTGLRITGVALLVFLAWVYRGGEMNNPNWLRTQWWGIIGLIGWAYLVAGLAYLVFRKQTVGLMGSVAILIAAYIGDKSGMLDFLGHLRDYLNIGGHIGGHSAITVCGMLVIIVVKGCGGDGAARERLKWIVTFGGGLLLAGYLLRSAYGISKNDASPTWCLYSAGICCCIFAVLHWVVDVRGCTRWAGWFSPMGAHPLLAYILPFMVAALASLAGTDLLQGRFGSGGAGIARSVVFTLLILATTRILARCGITLRL